MHIDCKQSFLILRRFCVMKLATRCWEMSKVEPVPRELMWEIKLDFFFFFFCLKAQRTRCTVCADTSVSVDLTEPNWNKSCYQWLWVIMPSVDDDVAGLLLTRHILYIWLSVVHVIHKDSHRARMHEAHGFSPTSPHTGIKHTTECTSTMRRKKTAHTEITIYTVALSKYTQK